MCFRKPKFSPFFDDFLHPVKVHIFRKAPVESPSLLLSNDKIFLFLITVVVVLIQQFLKKIQEISSSFSESFGRLVCGEKCKMHTTAILYNGGIIFQAKIKSSQILHICTCKTKSKHLSINKIGQGLNKIQKKTAMICKIMYTDENNKNIYYVDMRKEK